jgi:hypothetical protein
LGFQPPNSGFSGFYFSKSTSAATASDAGYLLIRGTSDSFPPYTAEGLTLVSDANSLNFFARGSSLISGGNAWVRMGTGSTESFRLASDYSYSLYSSRAPIFYDSDDTGYFTNPNSISSMFGVAIRGDNSASGTSNQIFFWGAGNTTTSSIGFKQVAGVWAEHGRTNGGYNTYFTMDTAGRGWVFRVGTVGGSNFTGTNVFSISNNSGETTIGSGWTGTTNAQLNITQGIGGATLYRDIDLKGSWSAGEGHAITAVHSTGSTNMVGQMVFQHDSPGSRIRWGRLYHGADSGSWPMDLISESTSTAYLQINSGSMRAPIFYDSDDTNYYVDPANGGFALRGGTSNRVTFFTNDSGFKVTNAEGNSVADVRLGAAWGSPGIYSSGSIYLMSEANVYFKIANADKGYMDSSSNLFAYGSMRSPIFYDYNDTGYYVNPNSTSNILSLTLSGYLRLPNAGYLTGDNVFEKLLVASFPNGTANLATDIRFGNNSFWGYIEVEITGTYSNQNTAGKMTKLFAVGTNPGNNIYNNVSRVADLMGTIVDNIAIGEFSWDASNSTYRIPISHIVATGNDYTIKVRMFTHGGGANAPYTALTLSSNYTLTALTGHTAVTYNVNLNTSGTLYAGGATVNTGWNGVFATNGVGAAGGNKLIYLYNDGGSNYKLDAYDYGTNSALNINIGGNGGYTTINASTRSPIFYDSNDTTYYVDPNSSSTAAILAGSVGVGTTSPVNSAWGNASTTKQITIYGTDYGVLNLRGDANTDAWYSMGAGDSRFYAAYDNIAGIHRLTFQGNNTGFNNVVSPSYNIHLSGTGYATSDWRAPIFYDSNDTGYYLDPASTSNLNATNFVGTSTWTGSAGSLALNLATNDGYASMRVIQNKNASGGNSDGMYIGYENGNSGITRIFGGGASSGAMIKYASYTEEANSFRAPIFYDSNNTGYYFDGASTSTLNNVSIASNVGIGVAPGSTANGARMELRGSGVWDAAFNWTNTGTGGRTWSVFSTNDSFGQGGGRFLLYNQTAGSNGFAVDASNNLTVGGNITAYGTVSDRRLKHNIREIPTAIKQVLALRPVYYSWNEDTDQRRIAGMTDDVGFIAQDVQEVEPLLVREGADGLLGLRERGIIAMLTKAFQEQNKEVVDLRAKVERLEHLISKLIDV